MAANKENIKNLKKEITCGICRSYFSEPVTISCGHSFCRACLYSCWRFGTTPSSCPECRQVAQVREIPGVNGRLTELTEVVKQLCYWNLQSAEGQLHCARHKLVFKVFCEDDQTPLCVPCSQSPEHGAHKLSPIQEAAHNCREKLRNLRRQLQKDLEESKSLLAREERPAVDWTWMVRGEYNMLQNFLVKEESRFLERIKQEEMAPHITLSEHIHTMRGLMLQLQEAGIHNNLDLLGEVKQLLAQSASLLCQRARTFPPELKEYPIPGMIEMLRRFTVDLTMHPSSATSPVIVSEDRKSVRAGEGWPLVTRLPEDTAVYFVFAEQEFSSGRHYWEVDVTQLPQWTLGIQISSHFRTERSGHEDTCAPSFLLCCVKKEEDYYLQTNPGSLNHRLKEPVPRIGVYLEYISGTLAFYNVLKCSPIYRFYPIFFQTEVTPIFSPGPPLPGTEAGPMTLCPVDSHF